MSYYSKIEKTGALQELNCLYRLQEASLYIFIQDARFIYSIKRSLVIFSGLSLAMEYLCGNREEMRIFSLIAMLQQKTVKTEAVFVLWLPEFFKRKGLHHGCRRWQRQYASHSTLNLTSWKIFLYPHLPTSVDLCAKSLVVDLTLLRNIMHWPGWLLGLLTPALGCWEINCHSYLKVGS